MAIMNDFITFKPNPPPTQSNATVYVVDDDPDLRRALSHLGKTVGLCVECFESANAFLDQLDVDRPSCLVLDVRLPEMNGMELQQELCARHIQIPIIMMSGYSEARTAVKAMHRGAVTYLEKPFGFDEMLGQIQNALRLDADHRDLYKQVSEFNELLSSLSAREHQVLCLLADGATTQGIANQLLISPKTVDSHRWKILEKLHVDSVVKLACNVLAHRHNCESVGLEAAAS